MQSEIEVLLCEPSVLNAARVRHEAVDVRLRRPETHAITPVPAFGGTENTESL